VLKLNIQLHIQLNLRSIIGPMLGPIDPKNANLVRATLDKLEKNIRLKDANENVKKAYDIAMQLREELARNKLPALPLAKFREAMKELPDSPEAIQEFIFTLGIQALKECKTKQEI